MRRAAKTAATQNATATAMMIPPMTVVVSGCSQLGSIHFRMPTRIGGIAPSTHACARPSAVLVRTTPSRRAISRSVAADVSRIFGRSPPV